VELREPPERLGGMKPARAPLTRIWSTTEIERLIDMCAKRADMKVMAKSLKRSRRGVEMKAKQLGLLTREDGEIVRSRV
jgi:hypothetical protein